MAYHAIHRRPRGTSLQPAARRAGQSHVARRRARGEEQLHIAYVCTSDSHSYQAGICVHAVCSMVRWSFQVVRLRMRCSVRLLLYSKSYIPWRPRSHRWAQVPVAHVARSRPRRQSLRRRASFSEGRTPGACGSAQRWQRRWRRRPAELWRRRRDSARPLRQSIAQVPRRPALQLMFMRPFTACCCASAQVTPLRMQCLRSHCSLWRCHLSRQLCVQLHPGPEADQHGTVRKPGSTRSRKRQESQKRWVDRQKASCSPCCLDCMLLAAAASAGASQRRRCRPGAA